jgi:hypothetical protein
VEDVYQVGFLFTKEAAMHPFDETIIGAHREGAARGGLDGQALMEREKSKTTPM